MRYQFEHFPNTDCLDIHVDVALPYVSDVDGGDYSGWDKLDEEDKEFFRKLEAIHGIEEVSSLHKYECHFSKGSVFSWDTIKPQILEAFRKRHSPTAPLVEIGAPIRWKRLFDDEGNERYRREESLL